MDAVHALLNHGARVNARNMEGKTALQVAEDEGYTDFARNLFELSARRTTRPG
jgi:ankyrin repeat protein